MSTRRVALVQGGSGSPFSRDARNASSLVYASGRRSSSRRKNPCASASSGVADRRRTCRATRVSGATARYASLPASPRARSRRCASSTTRRSKPAASAFRARPGSTVRSSSAMIARRCASNGLKPSPSSSRRPRGAGGRGGRTSGGISVGGFAEPLHRQRRGRHDERAVRAVRPQGGGRGRGTPRSSCRGRPRPRGASGPDRSPPPSRPRAAGAEICRCARRGTIRVRGPVGSPRGGDRPRGCGTPPRGRSGPRRGGRPGRRAPRAARGAWTGRRVRPRGARSRHRPRRRRPAPPRPPAAPSALLAAASGAARCRRPRASGASRPPGSTDDPPPLHLLDAAGPEVGVELVEELVVFAEDRHGGAHGARRRAEGQVPFF